MAAATRMALELGMVGEDFQKRLTALLGRAGLPLTHPDAPDLYDRILRALQLDKKFHDGKNLFVLPTGIGSWAPRENVDWSLVHDCVRAVLVA
jgi:3-dehydroquinate synthase